jgi:capsular polysaccharide biosynthesis protein
LRVSVGSTPNPGVLLVRGSTGTARRLTNENELIEALHSHHIKAIDSTTLTPDEIIESCSGAEVVIGVEGSQLSHGLVGSAPRAPVLTIQPPNRFNHVYKDRSDCLGKPYGFVVASGNGDEFSVDIDELKRVLDRLLKARNAR